MVSKFRPSVPIYAVSIDDSVIRRLSLFWGVSAIKIGRFRNTDEMTFLAEKALSTINKISKGDIVVLVAGVPVGRPGTTNLIKVHKIGEPIRLEK
jgi:pyruvate kinase